MKRFFLFIVLPLVLLAGVAAGGACWVWLDMRAALDKPIAGWASNREFNIDKGTSLATIAQRFEALGWIKDARYLRLEARRLGIAGSIKAGLYDVPAGITNGELLAKFVRGEVKTFRITFIEGSRFSAMLKVISMNTALVHELSGHKESEILQRVAPQLKYLEGWFFPSTYQFSAGDSDVDILKRAHARMLIELDEAWQNRAAELPYESAVDALIMASIIEKETGQAGERATIAGVFVRRLMIGMKLQTDPTVIYGLGDDFDGNLRRIDLQRDTPYNTYTREGLPPTPIALPGAASISAALQPEDGDFLYFVGKGDGSHEFSRSLKQHNRAVRRYQLGDN